MFRAYTKNGKHRITRKITNWIQTLLNSPKEDLKGDGGTVYAEI
jgi:hypothetical protein